VPDWHQVVETGRTAVLNVADGGRGDSARCAVAAPLIGSDGDLLGVVVVRNRLGNVTGFTDSDVETLETFAAQIGVSVSNDRLVDSLTQANLLNRQQEGLIKARDEFIASVSHELRTPLTTVVGLSQLLQSDEGETLNPEEREELTSLIVDQSIELSDLVEDLLVSARADVGNLHVTPRAVSLRGEVEAVLRAMRCDEFVGLLGESSTVWADALRLRQVVRNLVTNARRYGGERIWVELDRRPDGAILSVVDNGPGVAAGRERKIFEAYGRAHEPGSQPASIGLGLHVARQLARQMGGDLVYRRHDGLTRFELTLPAAA
jgi:signal transduction histidine kinase